MRSRVASRCLLSRSGRLPASVRTSGCFMNPHGCRANSRGAASPVSDGAAVMWNIRFGSSTLSATPSRSTKTCSLSAVPPPRVLWLDPPLGADLDGCGEFTCATGEFGHVFSTAAHQPEYVIAQRYQPGWKQSVACQRLPAWHPAWALTVFGLPDAPIGDGGRQESR